ncbi:hypothetical protein SRHO_G00033850 [Serrasalmus rhombeus]
MEGSHCQVFSAGGNHLRLPGAGSPGRLVWTPPGADNFGVFHTGVWDDSCFLCGCDHVQHTSLL